jgi:hypothetical protein
MYAGRTEHVGQRPAGLERLLYSIKNKTFQKQMERGLIFNQQTMENVQKCAGYQFIRF